MVRSVIGQMLQRLPEWVGVRTEIEGLIFHDAIQIALLQVTYEREEIVGLLFPVLAQRSDRLNVSVVRDGARRTSAKTLQPYPFSAANVNECVANRRKAGAERLGELFGGKLGGGV